MKLDWNNSVLIIFWKDIVHWRTLIWFISMYSMQTTWIQRRCQLKSLMICFWNILIFFCSLVLFSFQKVAKKVLGRCQNITAMQRIQWLSELIKSGQIYLYGLFTAHAPGLTTPRPTRVYGYVIGSTLRQPTSQLKWLELWSFISLGIIINSVFSTKLIEGAGHYLYSDKPKEFNEYVGLILKEVEINYVQNNQNCDDKFWFCSDIADVNDGYLKCKFHEQYNK